MESGKVEVKASRRFGYLLRTHFVVHRRQTFYCSFMGQEGKTVDWDSFFKVLSFWGSVLIIKSLPISLTL